MFIRYKGKTKLLNVPVTTSTAFSNGALVSYASGLIIPATATTTALSHVGVIRKAIASTDADYATARSVPVEVPLEKNVEWLADTASAVATDIGNEVDLTDSLTINRGATAIKVAMIRGLKSASQVYVVLKLHNSY